MATLTVIGTDLVLTLQPPERLMIRTWRRSAFKKMAAGRRQVRFPLSAVVLAEVVEKPLEVLGALGFRVDPFPAPYGTASAPLMSFAQLHKTQTFAAVYGTSKAGGDSGFRRFVPVVIPGRDRDES